MYRIVVFMILGFSIPAIAQKTKSKKAETPALPIIDNRIPLTAAQWAFKEGLVTFIDYKGQAAMKLAPNSGSVVLKNTDFKDGTIEFDVESILPSFAQSIYFHQKDDKEKEIVYLRLGTIGKPLANEGIQYCPYFDGVNMWDMYPQYQAPAPIKKDDWNHMKLVISGKQMRVYVNNRSTPVLEIPELQGRYDQGSIAFEGASYISNVIIKPNETEGLSPIASPDLSSHESNYIRAWACTKPMDLAVGTEVIRESMPSASDFTEDISAERLGLISLTRKFGANEKRRVVWLKAIIESESDQKVNIGLGFSDEIWVLLNGQMVYVDKNLYQQGMKKYPNGRISYMNGKVTLNLKKGINEITVAVANDFYGWGLIARLEETDGIIALKKFDAPAKINIENINQYPGTYSQKGMPIKINISTKEKDLYAQVTFQNPYKLDYKGHDLFELEAMNVKLQFKPNEKKLMVIQNGNEQIYEKE